MADDDECDGWLGLGCGKCWCRPAEELDADVVVVVVVVAVAVVEEVVEEEEAAVLLEFVDESELLL